MSVLSRFLPSAPPAPPLVLARGDAFFTRRVPLGEGEPAAAQALLALEGMAPFPPEQLFHGHAASADGRSALVFAAFRRRFDAEEQGVWAGAVFVTPEFLPLLLARPTGGVGVSIHVGESRLTGLAWLEGQELPEIVLVREAGPDALESFTAELKARAGLPADSPERPLRGVLSVRASDDDTREAFCGEESLGPLPVAWAESVDIRDPEFLDARRRARVRDEWLWRGLLGAAALLALAALLDLGAGGLHLWNRSLRARITAQAPTVQQTETAQTLANRIGELSERRLRAFKMLDLINPARPDTVIFQRVVTRGLLSLEVEAQTTNAEDVGTYANSLKNMPILAKVNTRVDGSRDGVTTFRLALDYKPDALREGGVQ